MPPRIRLYSVYGVLVAAAFTFALLDAIAFQKANTLRPSPGFEPLVATAHHFDVASVVAGIPFHKEGKPLVHPEMRHRATIVEGGGNCTQRAFGLAWQLEREQIDFQIVHILRPGFYLKGRGHTWIRVPFQYRGEQHVGLLDLVEAGLIKGDGGFLDVEAFAHGLPPEFDIEPLSSAVEPEVPFYYELLPGSTVGYIPAREVRTYFEFIERIYVPLGRPMLEKYLYDGLALLLGRLPEVSVPEYEYATSPHRVRIGFHRAALWVMRSTALLLPGMVLFEVVRARRRARRR